MSREVGAKVSGLMRQYGYSQDVMVEFLGISQPTLSRKLKGRSKFTPSEMVRLSELLEYPELLDLYPDVDRAEQDVIQHEILLKALASAIKSLTVINRRAFSLGVALLLAGILPEEAQFLSRLLRSLSKFDLPKDAVAEQGVGAHSFPWARRISSYHLLRLPRLHNAPHRPRTMPG